MSKVLSSVLSVSGLSARHDDDLTDRLVSRYTATAFVTFCVLVTTTTYVGKPIHCWCPAQFTGTHAAYANAKCLISPTYAQSFHAPLPQDAERDTQHINYYVWVPFILLCEACVCVLPSILWKSCYKGVGFNVPAAVERLESAQNQGCESKDKAVQYVVDNLWRYTQNYRPIGLRGPDTTCYLSKQSGNYLTLCFLCVKLLYVVVVTGQFLLLNMFLSMDFSSFGRQMLNSFLSGADHWTEIDKFPRVTMCEFEIRHMQVVQRWVVQCVLPINLFNEKLFLLVWLWLVVLSCCTIFSFLKWVKKSLYAPAAIYHLKQQLRFTAADCPPDYREKVEKFAEHTMRRDVLLLLRLVSHNVGRITEAEVIHGLWEKAHPTTFTPTTETHNGAAECNNNFPHTEQFEMQPL